MPAPDPLAAWISDAREELETGSLRLFATERAPRLLAAVERVLELADSWELNASRLGATDRAAGRVLRTTITAELVGKEDGDARVCMHADDDGAGSHLLRPGEECPLKQGGPLPSLRPGRARDLPLPGQEDDHR